MKRFLQLACFMLISNLSFSQAFDWVNSQAINFSSNPANLNSSLAISNNLLFHVQTDSNLQLFSSYAFGIQYLTTCDLSGTFLRNIKLYPKCDIQEIICDNNGNIFVAGNYLDTLFISNTDTLLNTGSGLNTNTFMICLNSNSQLIWKRNLSFNNSTISDISALDIDSQNNCWYAYSDFTNGYVTKLDASGQDLNTLTLNGAKTIGGISFDPTDNLFISGSAQSGPFSIGNLNYTIIDSYSYFVARYNSSLQPSWAKFAFDVTFHLPRIKADPFGNAYVCSNLMSSTSFGNISFDGPQWVYDFFALKVDSTGNFIWGVEVPTQVPSITGDYDPGNKQFLDCDSQGKLYIGGYVRGTVDFGNNVIATKGALNYSAMSFLAIDSSGIPLWCLNGGSNNYQHLSSIAIDDNDDLYFTGTIRGNAQFGNISVINNGATNLLLGKIDLNTAIGINEIGNSAITLFPNPSSGDLMIPSSLQNCVLTIYDVSGRIVFHSSKDLSSRINLHNLNSGMYMLSFSNGKENKTYRWIKSTE